MKNIFKIFITTIVLVFVLVGCGDKNVSEAGTTTEPTPEVTVTPTPTPEPDKMVSFTLDEIHEEGYLTPEEQAAADAKAADTQFLMDAIDYLGIGFNNYGIDFEIEGKNAYINHPDREGTVWKLCAYNSYLEEHEFQFIVPEGTEIIRFTPPTFESLDLGYVEDAPDTWASIGECYGHIWESEVDSFTGIQWEEKIIIVIDETYQIYINYKDEKPTDGEKYFAIH
ncbi:MAG: hypothetical protein IJW20_05030 [Clostridia bacterium]|nr:hypothetical protein [Clostridia bacterium]